MLGLLISSVIIGAIVAGISGIGVLGLIAAIIIFVCGLPFALIGDFVHGEVTYAQDRADYRQIMSDVSADTRELEQEYAADDRIDRLIASVKRKQQHSSTIYDNRQVHIHGDYK